MLYSYIPKGVCSRRIDIELDGQKIKRVAFLGGCNGNTSGISRLVAGMDAPTVISTLKGTTCGGKRTSCPDQLAIALEEALKNG